MTVWEKIFTTELPTEEQFIKRQRASFHNSARKAKIFHWRTEPAGEAETGSLKWKRSWRNPEKAETVCRWTAEEHHGKISPFLPANPLPSDSSHATDWHSLALPWWDSSPVSRIQREWVTCPLPPTVCPKPGWLLFLAQAHRWARVWFGDVWPLRVKKMWTDYTEVTRCCLDGSLGSKYGLWESPLADTHFCIPELMVQKRL